VPQFFPGPFAFLGLGEIVGGTWGTLYVVPILGALSVGMAFVLGRELFGRWAGLLGAALLAASFAQVWWARHPSSEIMAQFFVLAGLWLSARFARGAGPVVGSWPACSSAGRCSCAWTPSSPPRPCPCSSATPC
jgi:asparagine N-glycosylation enzyme membrane subunit Stt3